MGFGHAGRPSSSRCVPTPPSSRLPGWNKCRDRPPDCPHCFLRSSCTLGDIRCRSAPFCDFGELAKPQSETDRLHKMSVLKFRLDWFVDQKGYRVEGSDKSRTIVPMGGGLRPLKPLENAKLFRKFAQV